MDRNRWRINSVSGRTRDKGSVILKLKCYLKTPGCQSSTRSRLWGDMNTDAYPHGHTNTHASYAAQSMSNSQSKDIISSVKF